ncbi:hypothetical protein K438DRAFT_1783961 [Mycena galopus ATCC 62051]|nr:hypothetical protein K438DRAFT_1783961 [Mycena galopus ATCC 62051]
MLPSRPYESMAHAWSVNEQTLQRTAADRIAQLVRFPPADNGRAATTCAIICLPVPVLAHAGYRFLPIHLRSHYRLVLEARSTLLTASPRRVSPHRTSPASRRITALPLPHAASPCLRFLALPRLTTYDFRVAQQTSMSSRCLRCCARGSTRAGAPSVRYGQVQEEARERGRSSWEQAWPTRVQPYARRGGACVPARALSRLNSARRPPARGGGDDEDREHMGRGKVDSACDDVSVIAPPASRSRSMRWAGAREACARPLLPPVRTGRLGRGAARWVDGGAAAGIIEMGRGAGPVIRSCIITLRLRPANSTLRHRVLRAIPALVGPPPARDPTSFAITDALRALDTAYTSVSAMSFYARRGRVHVTAAGGRSGR